MPVQSENGNPGNIYRLPSKTGSGRGVAPGGGPPHDSDMEARVAVLEQIAKETHETLAGLRGDLKEFRVEMRAELQALRADMRSDTGGLRVEVGALRAEQRTEYRWLLGIILGVCVGLLGTLAKGFHWLG